MIGWDAVRCLLEWASLPNGASGSFLVTIGGFWQQLESGPVSFRGDLGSGLCFCGPGARPHTWGLGQDSVFPTLLINGHIFGPFTACSCLTTCLSSLGTWGPKSLGKGAETTLASSCWTGGSWGPGSQCPHSVRVHFWREMRVYGMRKALVLV